MKRMLLAAAMLAVATGLGSAAPKHKVKESVKYATDWDKAVAEAKLLNVPIVVHQHLFT